MQTPRLSVLRLATADLHANLERLVEAERFFASLPGYSAYLQRMHRFYREFSAKCAGAGPSPADLCPAFDRIRWLEQDLAGLGIEPLAAAPEAASPSSSRHDAHSRRLGALYVICGASLGARLLVQNTAALGLPDGLGQAYFRNVAAARDWRNYLEALEQALDPSVEALTAGAIETFGDIRRHLCEGPTR